MEAYYIVKSIGDNAFQVDLQPYLGMLLVFNVDLLKPNCPPLFESKLEFLVPTYLDLLVLQR